MMRLIQKFDKFDTNNQKIDQISKFDSSYLKSNIALVYTFLSFWPVNDGKIVPMLFYTAYLNRNGTILLELSLFSPVVREVAVVVSACIDGLPRKLFISFWWWFESSWRYGLINWEDECPVNLINCCSPTLFFDKAVTAEAGMVSHFHFFVSFPIFCIFSLLW
jgi:hypothetical protein